MLRDAGLRRSVRGCRRFRVRRWPTQVRWGTGWSVAWFLRIRTTRSWVRSRVVAAGAVGDGDEGRVEDLEFADGVVEVLRAVGAAGREELEREWGLVEFQEVEDVHWGRPKERAGSGAGSIHFVDSSATL